MKISQKKKKYIISTKKLSTKRKKELHEQYLLLIINRWNCRARYKMRTGDEEMRLELGGRNEATMPLHHRLRKNKKIPRKADRDYPLYHHNPFKQKTKIKKRGRWVQRTLDGRRIKEDNNEYLPLPINQNTRNKVKIANKHHEPTLTPSQKYGPDAHDEVISFEHININGINAHDNFVELDNVMGILRTMEAGVFSINEHNMDTTNQLMMKKFWDTIKRNDKHAKVKISSNKNEKFEHFWKPGGTMLGASSKWAGRVVGEGTDMMGRWSWLDFIGKGSKKIRVISAYRVSQDNPEHAGELTSCRQQWRSHVKNGIRNPNPKQLILDDLTAFISDWRNQSHKHSVILMMDSNEKLEVGKPLYDFMVGNDLMDAMEQLNPSAINDKTYLEGSKRIDHIFLTPDLAEIALKAGHHPFHQYFISDHKGIYIQFQAKDFFDDPTVDQTFFSYRGLQMDKRSMVEKYVEKLESIYNDN